MAFVNAFLILGALILGFLCIAFLLWGACELGFWIGGIPHEAKQRKVPPYFDTHERTGDPRKDYGTYLLARVEALKRKADES